MSSPLTSISGYYPAPAFRAEHTICIPQFQSTTCQKETASTDALEVRSAIALLVHPPAKIEDRGLGNSTEPRVLVWDHADQAPSK